MRLGAPAYGFSTRTHIRANTHACKQRNVEKIGATKSLACLRDGLRSPRRLRRSIEFAAFPARERAKDRENRERQSIETSCAYRFAPTASCSRPPRARFFHRSLKKHRFIVRLSKSEKDSVAYRVVRSWRRHLTTSSGRISPDERLRRRGRVLE